MMFQKKQKMKKKLNEIFDMDWVLDNPNSIFHYLKDATDYPLVNAFINSENQDVLDESYYIEHSADKYISPILEKYVEKFAGLTMQADVSQRLAKMIYHRYGLKWNKIYTALLTQYNPLENYSMEEIRTPDLSFDETENQKSKLETERTTHADSKYKGFNADDPVTINQTDGTEDSDVSGGNLDNEIHKVSEHTGTETLTRSGNIGITSSQQMLEQEFKVRQYDFYKMIYNDIDSILCLSVY